MMKNIKYKGHQVGEIEYKSGKTELTPAATELLKEVSMIIYGYSNNYTNIHKNYAPEGIVKFLIDQVKLRVNEKEINEYEQNKALLLIEQLEEVMVEVK